MADIVSRRRPGRCSADEIIVFDSTVTARQHRPALEDVAAATVLYERAVAAGHSREILLGA